MIFQKHLASIALFHHLSILNVVHLSILYSVLLLLARLSPFGKQIYGLKARSRPKHSGWVKTQRFLRGFTQTSAVDRITKGTTIGALTVPTWVKFQCKYVGGISRKAVVYLFARLIFSPSVLVGAIFKNNWSRARPLQVTEFGGKAESSPAFVRLGECGSKYSFVGSRESVGFYLAAIALLIKGRHRAYVAWPAPVYGSMTGAGRIIPCGYFFQI